MNRLKNKQQGLILIELLTAMAIFAVGIITIFALFVNATTGTLISLDKIRANFLSIEALEAAYSLSKSDPDYLIPGKYEVGVNADNQWVLMPKAGLMGHFLMANDVKDSSIYANHGIAQNISFFENRKGQIYGAARFNGVNSSVNTQYGFSLQITGPLTISAWVMDTAVGSEAMNIAGKYDASEGEEEGGYMIYKEGDNYYFMISGSGSTASISAPSDNLPWEHIAGVYDPGNQTMRLYINGQTEEEPTATNITSINKVPYVEFSIGNDDSGSRPWHGLISDVRVYNRSLTANEISGLYNSYSVPREKALVVQDILSQPAAIWNFNEGQGCVAHDNSGNNNHGIIENCSPAQWAENRHGKQGRAFYFGENNYAEADDSSSLQIEEEISISFWLKAPEVLPETEMTILHKIAENETDYSFSIIYNGTEKGLSWATSAGQGSTISGVKLDNAFIANKWQHIVATFNGTGRKIYIDDNEMTGLSAATLGNSGDNSNLFIGRNASGQNQLSEFAIDDLRIYSKTLEPVEIKSIFLETKSYYLE